MFQDIKKYITKKAVYSVRIICFLNSKRFVMLQSHLYANVTVIMYFILVYGIFSTTIGGETILSCTESQPFHQVLLNAYVIK